MIISNRKLLFSKVSEGSNVFKGGGRVQPFPGGGGVQMLISIENSK